MELPHDVRTRLAGLLEGVSRNSLARHAASLSALYRGGANSDEAIRSRDDALAYAVTRLPATFAAAAAAMREVARAWPDFAPTSILDLGAGPGSATIAAVATWPSIRAATLVEPNPRFAALARELVAAGDLGTDAIELLPERLERGLGQLPQADLVICGYVLVEFPADRVAALARDALGRARHLVLHVEPGTPRGFERILEARRTTIAANTHIIAPCPGNAACPLVGPDWCHFPVRLARLRDHRLLKAAELPFEDEKFCYLAASRDAAIRPMPRLIAAPSVGRAEIAVRLCTADGVTERTISRRNKAGYKLARKLAWGDGWPLAAPRPDDEPEGTHTS